MRYLLMPETNLDFSSEEKVHSQSDLYDYLKFTLDIEVEKETTLLKWTPQEGNTEVPLCAKLKEHYNNMLQHNEITFSNDAVKELLDQFSC